MDRQTITNYIMIERFERTIELEDNTVKRTELLLLSIRNKEEYGVERISDKETYEMGFGFKVTLKEGVYFQLIVAECRKHLRQLKRVWRASPRLKQFTVISRTLKDVEIIRRLIDCIDTARHAVYHWREQRQMLRKQKRYERRHHRPEPIYLNGTAFAF